MKIHYAMLSGMFAASAGALGKLSGLDTLEGFFIIRLILFLAMLVCNAAVWTLFVRALHQSDSSLKATIISSTSNYMFTALLGFFLLGEEMTIYWWLGMVLIVLGLSLIISDDKAVEKVD